MRYTPWGKPDHSVQIVRGITDYYTPSHGGLFVTVNAAKKYLRKPVLESDFLRNRLDAKANGYWLEEDCDAAVALFELCYTAKERMAELYKGRKTVEELKASFGGSIDRWNGWYKYERGADGKAA